MKEIVFSTDNNFYHQTSVAIASLLEHNTDVNITILVGDEFSHTKDIPYDVNFINVDGMTTIGGKEMRQLKLRGAKALYYRLFIPQIFEGKVLYLDSDIIVKKDLTELFEKEIDYIGCVEHIQKYEIQHYPTQYADYFETYYNSGMLLMNCGRLREYSFTEKCFKNIKEEPDLFPDQDAINRVMNGMINKLSKLFNLQTNELYKDYFHDEAFVIHYLQEPKPWENINKIYNKEYLKYKKIYAEKLHKTRND